MTGITCSICPHHCQLREGQTGICRARTNRGGVVKCDSYGLVTSIALDPIEKKPLLRFYPGSMILSVGSYGCNLRCPFCQNFEISMSDRSHAEFATVSPHQLIENALGLIPSGNIGVAFTYNEPLIGYEYVYDSSVLAKENDLKTVLVTNGFVNEAPLLALLPYIDAMNIDLKSFSEDFYRRIGGNLEDIKRTISLSVPKCHVEVTTLIIPGENDTEDEMRKLSHWLASVSPDTALHVTRFFPSYKMRDRKATDPEVVFRLARAAREVLRYVYEGNC